MPSLRSFVCGCCIFAIGVAVGRLDLRPNDASGSSLAREKGSFETIEVAGEVNEARNVASGSERAVGPAPDPTSTDVVGDAIRASLSIRAGRSFGSGILIAPGTVLTALHVVDGADAIEVRFHDSDWLPATVLAIDDRVDLALLRTASDDRATATLGSVASIRPGDGVLAVGNPRELAFSVTRGVASYVGREMNGIHYLQTDLGANPGSSGGPVIDEAGHVVAMMTFILRDSAEIAFAIPVDYAVAVFPSFVTGAPPSASWVATDLGGAPTHAHSEGD